MATAGRMEELRGKASGLYVLQTANINKNIEDMSEQELEEKMKKIVDDYKHILKDQKQNSKSQKKPN